MRVGQRGSPGSAWSTRAMRQDPLPRVRPCNPNQAPINTFEGPCSSPGMQQCSSKICYREGGQPEMLVSAPPMSSITLRAPFTRGSRNTTDITIHARHEAFSSSAYEWPDRILTWVGHTRRSSRRLGSCCPEWRDTSSGPRPMNEAGSAQSIRYCR